MRQTQNARSEHSESSSQEPSRRELPVLASTPLFPDPHQLTIPRTTLSFPWNMRNFVNPRLRNRGRYVSLLVLALLVLGYSVTWVDTPKWLPSRSATKKIAPPRLPYSAARSPRLEDLIRVKLPQVWMNGTFSLFANYTILVNLHFRLREDAIHVFHGPVCSHIYAKAYDRMGDVIFSTPCLSDCIGYYSEHDPPRRESFLSRAWKLEALQAASIVRLDDEHGNGSC